MDNIHDMYDTCQLRIKLRLRVVFVMSLQCVSDGIVIDCDVTAMPETCTFKNWSYKYFMFRNHNFLIRLFYLANVCSEFCYLLFVIIMLFVICFRTRDIIYNMCDTCWLRMKPQAVRKYTCHEYHLLTTTLPIV